MTRAVLDCFNCLVRLRVVLMSFSFQVSFFYLLTPKYRRDVFRMFLYLYKHIVMLNYVL